jgi:hypothetical protein
MRKELLNSRIVRNANQLDSISFLKRLLNKGLVRLRSNNRLLEIFSCEHTLSTLSVICHNWGIGKSTAIAQYVFSNPNAYYLRVGDRSYGCVEMLRELIYEVSRINPTKHRTKNQLRGQACELLNSICEKKILFIDDSSKLSIPDIKFLFGFHKSLNDTALIFIGDLRFHRSSFKYRYRVPCAELLKMVNNWYKEFPNLTACEVRIFCNQRGTNFCANSARLLKCKTICELESITNEINFKYA